MGIFSSNKKEYCMQSEIENKLIERVAELEVESMHKSEDIEKLKEELCAANKTILNLDRLRECQDRIINVYKSMYDKEDTSVDNRLEDYITRQRRIFDNKVNHGFNTTNIYQEARYILEEVTELMRAIEKNDRENMIEELADIVIFAYGCTEVARLGDLDTKIFEKMKLNESRKYTMTPEGDFVKTGLNS